MPRRSRTQGRHPGARLPFPQGVQRGAGKKVTEISEGAISALVNYGWPGNVRELENVMHRAAILTGDHVIRQAHLVTIIDPAHAQADLAVPRTGDELKRVKKAAREKSVEEIEKQFVLEALKRNEWNVTKSAEDTGMQRPNFQALMKKYAIRVRDTEHDGGEAPDAYKRRIAATLSLRARASRRTRREGGRGSSAILGSAAATFSSSSTSS